MKGTFEIPDEEIAKLFAKSLPQTKPAEHKINNETLDFKEACAHLKLSGGYLYKLTSKADVPHYKRGKRLFFKRSELDAWLVSEKVV